MFIYSRWNFKKNIFEEISKVLNLCFYYLGEDYLRIQLIEILIFKRTLGCSSKQTFQTMSLLDKQTIWAV